MPGEKFTVGAIGVGPVGTILATCLAKAGAEIIAADIPKRIAQVRENGLHVHWGERRLEYPAATVDSIPSLAQAGPDCIFIATKACILKKIMPQVAEAAGDDLPEHTKTSGRAVYVG